MLKQFLFFCALFLSGEASYDQSLFPNNIKEFFKAAHNKCQAETGVTQELIDNVNNGDFSSTEESLKCYMKCTMIENTTMNPDGSIGMDLFEENGMLEKHPNIDTYKDMFSRCAEQLVEPDLCDRAREFHMCVYKDWPDMYFCL